MTFGEIDVMSFDFIDDENIVVGYENTPELKIVRLDGKVVKTSNFKIDLPVTAPISYDKHLKSSKHDDIEPHYKQARFHPGKELIYRCYKGRTESADMFDFSENKLMIVDKNLDIIYDQKLPEVIMPLLFPYQDGLAGLVLNTETEDYIVVARIIFMKKQT